MRDGRPFVGNHVFSVEELASFAPNNKRIQRLILALSEYMTAVDMCLGFVCESPRTANEEMHAVPCDVCGKDKWLLDQLTPEVRDIILQKIYEARRVSAWRGKKYLGAQQ